MIATKSLTADGLAVFADWLAHGEGDEPPAELRDDCHSEPMLDVTVDPAKEFASRFEFGVYLCDRLAGMDHSFLMAPERDGFWAWLATTYFGQLRKRNKTTGRFQGPEHFIVQRRGLRGSLAYRHAARTSFDLVRVHGEAAKVCLLRSMNTFGDTAEQLASRTYLAASGALFGAAATLYLRDGALARGASSKPTPPRLRGPDDRKGYGGLRRLETQLGRLQCTFDTDVMTPGALIDLLPREFDIYRRQGISN